MRVIARIVIAINNQKISDMKTIEEKARAYDEAIRKLRGMMPNWERLSYNGKTFLQDLIYIIPELAESEDEKVRKELIKHLKELCDWKEDEVIPVKNPSYYRQWASWLEKQGEQKFADTDNKFIRMRETKPKDISEFLDRLTTVEQEFLWEHIAKIKELDKEEQKSTDKVEPRFKVKYAGSEYNVLEVKDIAGVTFYGIEDEPNHIDYVKAENCEIISGYAIKENGSPYPTKPAVFSEKKPAVWSEENEELLKWSINNLTELKDRFGEEYGKVGKCIDWLRALRPQNHWKPSSEQIRVCKEVYADILSAKGFDLGTVVSELNRLKEGLKKKGE